MSVDTGPGAPACPLSPGDPGADPAAAPPARLFLALWPTPALRARLVAWRDACTFPPGAAVVPAEKLHVTLHFIGPVPRAAVPAIAAGLERPPGAFELRFGTLRVWPGGLAVLEPQAVPPGLRALHERLAEALRALRLPVEARPYRPHVTLSRRAAGMQPAAPPPDLRWRSHGYVLVESRPGPQGGYDVLRHYS